MSALCSKCTVSENNAHEVVKNSTGAESYTDYGCTVCGKTQCDCTYCRRCYRDLRADAYCDCDLDGHVWERDAAEEARLRGDAAFAWAKDKGASNGAL